MDEGGDESLQVLVGWLPDFWGQILQNDQKVIKHGTLAVAVVPRLQLKHLTSQARTIAP